MEPQSLDELTSILRLLLDEYLGRFSTGDKAFWIERPFIPQQLKAEGLQCIVQRDSQPVTTRRGYPGTIQYMCWKVTLTLFSRSFDDEVKFESAKDRIRGQFPKHTERPYPRSELTYPAVDFLIYFNRVTFPIEFT